MFHGNGTYEFPDGEKYVGKWKNHKKHGQGNCTLADGKKKVGKWKDNEFIK